MATPAASSASVTGMRIRPCPMDCRASNKLMGTSRSPSVCPTGPTAFKDSARSLCERDSMAPDLSSKTSAAVASAGNTITECPCAVDAAHVCAALACSTLRKCSCQPSPDAATRGLAHSGVRLEASQLPPSSQLPQSNGSVIKSVTDGCASHVREVRTMMPAHEWRHKSSQVKSSSSKSDLTRLRATCRHEQCASPVFALRAHPGTVAIRAMLNDSRTRVTHKPQPTSKLSRSKFITCHQPHVTSYTRAPQRKCTPWSAPGHWSSGLMVER